MRHTYFRITVLVMLLTAGHVSAASWQKQGQEVTIHVENGVAQTIRLQVVADNIIRVEQTPDTQIPQKKTSLIIVPEVGKNKVPYSVTEDETAITVQAPQISAHVDKATGHVSLYDASGKRLLAEKDKSFKRYISPQTTLPEGYHPTSKDEVPTRFLTEQERSGYSWRVLFETSENEAVYGLGQHQSQEMNYKGKNEELFQYNTKVSIPFVISTNGYGLLWDSYSYGRWGNPSPWQQLGQVFDLDMTGTYTAADGTRIVRQEDSLYYENLDEVKRLPNIPLNGSYVTYEGILTAPKSDVYHFILYYAGYTKVYIDGHLVVPERWRTAWNPNAYKFDAALLEGRKTPIRIEWKPDGDVSYCGLRVANPSTQPKADEISVWAEMDRDIDYYVIAASTPDDIIAGYRYLTGKASVLPRWSFGYWQSRERYSSQQEIVETTAEFRRRHIPMDVMVQDWFYWKEDQWGSFSYDPTRFPNPQEMYDTIHAMNAKLMISSWPKYYCNTDNYKELNQNGWIYQQAVMDSIRDWVGPGYIGSFYDAYSKGAREMFWRHMSDNLYTPYKRNQKGKPFISMDAWWMDASEPNVRDCTPIAYRKLLCGPTALGTSDEYFNAYSIVNADAIYTGQRTTNPNQRVFLLTRSGFAGEQRYSTVTWSGDIGTRWEDLRAQITAGLNFSMAGVPFWSMDIGGFCVETRYQQQQDPEAIREWRELQTRWHEFGCFAPLYRSHGQSPRREVWNIAPEDDICYQTIVNYDRLRYRMLPYIYSIAGWIHLHDYTMMRGLAMDFSSDSRVWNIDDEWMFGPSLLVCPVTTYRTYEREVYFPKTAGWYDLYTGKYQSGGESRMVKVPLEKIPVYVKAGTILPIGPAIEYTDQKKADTLTVYVYAGQNGSFELYEDDGTTYGYERGQYALIPMTYDDTNRTLTFGNRKGSYSEMLKSRIFRVVYVSQITPRALLASEDDAIEVNYEGKHISIQM